MATYFLAGHALIMRDDGKVLITKRGDHDDYMPGTWDLPGGTADGGETLEDATRREVKEEVGLEIVIESPIFTFTNLSQPNRETLVVIYLVQHAGEDIALNPDEHSQYKWVTLADIATFNTTPFLTAFVQESTWLKTMLN